MVLFLLVELVGLNWGTLPYCFTQIEDRNQGQLNDDVESEDENMNEQMDSITVESGNVNEQVISIRY